ncbi:Solute carrier family 22 member 6-B [Holothuria leucospilota]|uniref:Solute carrier family 22 member 6-B n=1 Tax=Holothuria leucospilota TaxID=206669 RepID=A0A9Q1BDK2_HOLLE|nr:Solute carrier family 22 member 6-B [Holothuria leucospilota]
MDFDEALKSIGNFGKYQKALSLLLSVPILIGCLQIYVQVFAAGESDHWCQSWKEDNCKDLNLTEIQCENLKKEISIPAKVADDNKTVFEHCEKYNVTGKDLETVMLADYINSTIFEKIPCDEGWVHDRSTFPSTIVIDFELVCGRSNLPNVAQSAYFGGYLVGSIFGGATADVIGRRWALLLSNILVLATGMANVFSPNMLLYIILRFLTGTFARLVSISSIVLTAELVSPVRRVTVTNILFLGWALGYFVLSGLAKLIPNWRFLQLAITVPYLPLLILELLFVVESPRWFIVNDKTEEAERALKKIARFNGRNTADNILKPSKSTHEIQTPEKTKRLLKQLLHSRVGILITINMCFNWFVQSVVYYGLSLSTSSLGIDPYISFIVSGAIEIPAYVLCMYLPEWIGRKGTTCSTLVFGGISCCLSPLLPPGVWRALLAMAGKFCVTISFSLVYTWAIEITPTSLRSTGMGLFSMSSRIGGMLVPFLLILEDVWLSLPIIIMGSASIIAGLLSLLLPETKGRPLPCTIHDTENLYQYV